MIVSSNKLSRTKESKYGNTLAIVVKLTNWKFSEEIKARFIKAVKDGNNTAPIIVLQMYLPALMMQQNEALMKKPKELKGGRYKHI